MIYIESPYNFLPALALPIVVAVVDTLHSRIPATPVISAHTCTDPPAIFSATFSVAITIWIAAVSSVYARKR